MSVDLVVEKVPGAKKCGMPENLNRTEPRVIPYVSKCLIIMYLPKTCISSTITQNPNTS